jgi:hypothetical protein
LPAFEIAVRRSDDTSAGWEMLASREEAHRAAGFAPLKARVREDAVKPFRLGTFLDRA